MSHNTEDSAADPLAAALARNTAPRSDDWRVQRFDPAKPEETTELAALLAQPEPPAVYDTLANQLDEWIEIQGAGRPLSPTDHTEQIQAITQGMPLHRFGIWVYHPWAHRLVHVLPEPLFRTVRSSRNRYKITEAEQDRLARKAIGVVGLSVGQTCAMALALEGIGGTLKLADLDQLSLSNINRLRAGVHEVGAHKAVLAARALAEVNPFLNIEIFPEGLTPANLEAFMEGLHLVVEECDDFQMKVEVRAAARARQIPVIMDTNDRGMLDIERFDLEPERPLFHGLMGDVDARALAGLDAKAKLPYVTQVLGGPDALGGRVLASLFEIKQSLTSWPQLSSGVHLGAALVADAARRTLLDTLAISGRFYVDLDVLIADGQQAPVPAFQAPQAVVPDQTLRPALSPLTPIEGAPTSEDLVELVRWATLAPSGGNVQPWTFEIKGRQIIARADPERADVFLDFERQATHATFGAVAENLALAGAAMGLPVQIEVFPEGPGAAGEDSIMFVAEVPDQAVEGSAIQLDPLTHQMDRRVTNRQAGDAEPLTEAEITALTEAAEQAGARLQLATTPEAIAALGQIQGEGDRLRFLNARMHREMMSELRLDAAEAEATRDGIDAASLELPPEGLTMIRLLQQRSALAFMADQELGQGLAEPARAAFGDASAVGLLTMPSTDAQAVFKGGRALQRVWLTATGIEVALWPYTALIYLFARLERGQAAGLSFGEQETLQDLRLRFGAHFDVQPDHSEILLFRLAHAGPPTARALRRSVVKVLRFTA